MTDPENRRESEGRSVDLQLPSSAPTKGAIYLSWGGKVYGPSTREEVVAGIRTAWFEAGALYWHEGLDQWKPVHEFPVSDGATKNTSITRKSGMPAAPPIPRHNTRAHRPSEKSGHARSARPASRRLGRKGRAVFLGFALLAVLLTVGILLLLTLV